MGFFLGGDRVADAVHKFLLALRLYGCDIANFRIREFTEKFILIPRLDMEFGRDRHLPAIAFSAEFTGDIVKTL